MGDSRSNYCSILQLISKYRTELMGVGILGVLMGHLLMYTNHQLSAIDFFCRIVHTQGFLFVSGFGLYYSFSSDSNLVNFYKKRFNRLYVPFFFISLLFFTLVVYYNDENYWMLFVYLTTLDFWIEGNDFGMWYIAISILLYLLYPLMHKFVCGNASVLYRGFAIVLFIVVICFAIKLFSPSYWEIISFGVEKTSIFPIGIIAGFYAKSGKQICNKYIVMYFLVMLSLLILFHSIDKNYYEQIRTLIGIPVVCIVLSLLNRENAIYGWVFKPLKWLGSYSLEIYLLHLQIWRGLAFVTTWDSTIRIIIAIPLTLLLCQPVHNGINSILKSKYYCIK